MNPINEQLKLTRRNFLSTAASGIGSIALSSLMAQDGFAMGGANNPLAQKMPHFAPTAKRCIFFFMAGAPSQIELFTPKPKLQELDGKGLPAELLKDMRFAFIEKETAVLKGTNAKFKQHGQSGMWFSDYLPYIAKHADELCMINTMHTEEFNHHPGQLMLQCGDGAFGLPTMGSWLSYGLGTPNHDLPGYVVLTSGRGSSAGTTMWQSGFLPSIYEGVRFRTQGEAILNLSNPAGLPDQLQRAGLDALAEINQASFQTKHDIEIASRISNYELAYRMQTSAPDLIDLGQESAATREMYGIDREDGKVLGNRSKSGGEGQYHTFASNCLLARRMVERGVRFVNLVHATWDDHDDLTKNITFNTGMCDQPIAALLTDLKQRGLLDETLVVWGAEFGRTPLGENRKGKTDTDGRDHHPGCYSMWMAGGGVKGGYTHGESDDIGWNIVKDGVHVNDFQATLLHMFGLDHNHLTYRHRGLDQKLTSITRQSEVIHDLLA